MRKYSLLIFMLTAITALAQDFTYNGIPYTVYDKEAKTCMVRPVHRGETSNDISGNVILPSKVYDGETEYTLVKIGLSAFNGCINLTSVEIPETVTYIDGKAFYGCSGLSKINMPEGIESIQANTFRGCSGLTEIRLPSNLKAIRRNAFTGCSSLQRIELPESLEILEGYAFSQCTSLKDVNIPHLITVIPINCFYGTGLKSIVIPENVTRISSSAFRSSTLEDVEFPEGLTNIGWYAFYGCSNLQKIKCKSVEPPILNECTFSNSNNSGCVLTVPAGSEQSYIFGGWMSQNNYGFPNAVNSNGDKVEPKYITDYLRYVVDDKSKTAYVVQPGNSSYTYETVDIPETVMGYKVTGIAPYAFYRSLNLKSVYLPNSLKEIGSASFAKVSNLESLLIPSGVTKMGDGVFCGAGKLNSVNLPSSITEIGDYMFESTAITGIEIPSGVKRIGNSAFDYCSSLKSIVLPQGLEYIDEWAFYTTKLQSVEIPQSVNYIASNAFSENSSLESINIPDGLKSLNYAVLSMDVNIKNKMVIPSSVEYIGYQAMMMMNPKEMYLGSGVKEIGESAIDATNIYISAQEPPVTNGKLQLFVNPESPEVTVYVQGEEAKKRYESVYPWYTYKIVNMVEATEIKTNIESVEGKAGESFKPEVTFVPADASMQQVIWSSTNPRVATVDSNGVITITEPGSDVPGSRAADYIPENSCKIIATTLYHDGPVAEIQVTNTSIILGVEDVAVDAEAPAVPNHIYNMQGICIKKNATDSDVNSLTPGLYIIGGKKVLVR